MAASEELLGDKFDCLYKIRDCHIVRHNALTTKSFSKAHVSRQACKSTLYIWGAGPLLKRAVRRAKLAFRFNTKLQI